MPGYGIAVFRLTHSIAATACVQVKGGVTMSFDGAGIHEDFPVRGNLTGNRIPLHIIKTQSGCFYVTVGMQVRPFFAAGKGEKMAADEKFEKKNMDKVFDAVRMTEQINKQYGFGPASEKGEILKVGISFNDDGTTSYFAELEKMSESQRERLEKAIEQKKDLKDLSIRSKRTQVSASSMKELIEKMNKVDWSKIQEQDLRNYKPGFDFSI